MLNFNQLYHIPLYNYIIQLRTYSICIYYYLHTFLFVTVGTTRQNSDVDILKLCIFSILYQYTNSQQVHRIFKLLALIKLPIDLFYFYYWI